MIDGCNTTKTDAHKHAFTHAQVNSRHKNLCSGYGHTVPLHSPYRAFSMQLAIYCPKLGQKASNSGYSLSRPNSYLALPAPPLTDRCRLQSLRRGLSLVLAPAMVSLPQVLIWCCSMARTICSLSRFLLALCSRACLLARVVSGKGVRSLALRNALQASSTAALLQ